MRYATLLLELAQPVPRLRIRHRPALWLRRRNSAGVDFANDIYFDRLFKVTSDANPDAVRLLTGPVRRALLHLRSVTGPNGEDEFVRLDGHVMRVVADAWPGSRTVEAVLAATVDAAAVLAAAAQDTAPPAGP